MRVNLIFLNLILEINELLVDQVLDSCFKLLSLFFMTTGRNNEAPAMYALLSTINRILNHLIEADLYSNKDLIHISATLDRLRDVVKKAHESYSEKLTALLTSRIDYCQSTLTKLRDRLAQINEELYPIHENLICISRLISSANTRTNVGRHLRFLIFMLTRR